MTIQTTSAEVNPIVDPLYFSAQDVTATQRLELSEVDGYRPAGEVAETVALEMDLPEDVPYSLRDNSNARMLVDDQALGSQIQRGAELVLIPRSHLG